MHKVDGGGRVWCRIPALAGGGKNVGRQIINIKSGSERIAGLEPYATPLTETGYTSAPCT